MRFQQIVRHLRRHVEPEVSVPDPHEVRDAELGQSTAEVLDDIDGVLFAA